MNNRHTFFQFVIPSVMAFALSGVYTIVDGLFVGHSLGDSGLAAINLAYPIAAFIQAVGTGIGLSGAIHYAILRGQKEHSRERQCFTHTVWLLLISSILITAVILAAMPLLLRLFGAEGELYSLMKEYLQVIAIGAVLQIFATGLVPFIRNLGGASFAMFTMIAGFVTNIILDYLFVWIWGRGMEGAAWATVIGQGVTMALAVGYLARKKMKLCLAMHKSMWREMGSILKVAVAPFGLTFSPQITTILMNRALMTYQGEQAVAIYGCIIYIIAIVYLLLQGVGDGSQPLISRFYGENEKAVLKQMRKMAYLTSGGIALLCMAGIFLLRGHIGLLFGASAETNEGVAFYIPFFLLSLLFLSYTRITTAFLYATEKAGLSYLLVYAEPAAILFLLLTLPHISVLHNMGVWIAVPLAQCMTWCIAFAVKHRVDRKTFTVAAMDSGGKEGRV